MTVRRGIQSLFGAGLLLLAYGLLLALPRAAQAVPPGPPASHPAAATGPLPFLPGDVLAAVGAGIITQYHSDGTLVQAISTGSGSFLETGLCFDQQERLYSTNWSYGNMTQFDHFGQILQYPWGGPFGTRPESCVVDAAGNLYVGETTGENALRKFDPMGNLLATYHPDIGGRGIDRIDLAADQCTIYYNSINYSIMRFDICTNTQLPALITNLPTQTFSLRIRPNGEVLVGGTVGGYRVSPSGTLLQTYPNPPGVSGFMMGLTLDPDGTTFWGGLTGTRGQIYRIDIESGAVQTTFDTYAPSGVGGLAIFGEHGVGQGTPTPSATLVAPSTTPTLPPKHTATLVAPSTTPTSPPTSSATLIVPSTTPTPLPPKHTATPTPIRTPQLTVCPPQTPTRLPTPVQTLAPGCSANPHGGDLRAVITDQPTTTEALFTNHSATCSYRIGLAAYEKHDAIIEHQELYDYTLAIIPPNSTMVLRVNNPVCAYQTDAFWGNLIESFAGGVRYNERRLDDTEGNGHDYCSMHCVVTPIPPPPTRTPTSLISNF